MQQQPKLIAIVGGSGAGKTWLARRLKRELSPNASCLSLDDFYHDRASLEPHLRETINYDHPRAIDWPRLEKVLLACRAGKCIEVPSYRFTTHTRMSAGETFSPRTAVLVDGLWLLERPRIRALFDFSVYVDCPLRRLERRIERDAIERGREPKSVREQFWKTVAPMHDRYVAPQIYLADVVLKQPSTEADIEDLIETIRALMTESETPLFAAEPAFAQTIFKEHA